MTTKAQVPHCLQKHQELVHRALTALETGDNEKAIALATVARELRGTAELAFHVQQAISPTQVGSTRLTSYWKTWAEIK
ncbi:hypothetical protein ABZ897_57780 [Nonomuraea sp. NPDC046802]|uniref:hypothetical protein n=1 Tax=Nonomuraea sp. NPDC046802 TaxID=3154919 RepID=UPI0033EBB992